MDCIDISSLLGSIQDNLEIVEHPSRGSKRQKRTQSTTFVSKPPLIDSNTPNLLVYETSNKKKTRFFDWSIASFGQFLLKIAYVGSRYSGVAWQKPTAQTEKSVSTVEGKLFEAMRKTCLITDRKSCHFSRCGRTDKGVHAAGNYISVRLRLKPGCDGSSDGYDYPTILNSVLPNDIRIVDCQQVPDHFDARFQCLYRVYKYLFLGNGLNIERMISSAQQYVGEHDFRNFCKLDADRVRHFRRKILWVKFRQADSMIWEVEIAGLSFLWHQIRCMMAILFLIGRGLEEPNVITKMLDIEKTPRKPVYELADDAGLILYDCFFEGLHFRRTVKQMRCIKTVNNLYNQYLQHAAVLRCMSFNDLTSGKVPHSAKTLNPDFSSDSSPMEDSFSPAPLRYTSLLERPTTMSLEEKKAAVKKKQKEKKTDCPK